MDNLVILSNWLEKHSNNDQQNDVLLLEFSKVCRLCLKESLNMYGIRNHLVEFEDGSLFLEKVISNLLAEDEESAEDDYPENICLKCSEMILQFYEFKIRCKKTREALTIYNKIITQDVVRDLDKKAGPIIQNLSTDADQQETKTDYDEFYDHCPVGSESSQDKPDQPDNINVIKIELIHPSAIGSVDTGDADEKSSSATSCQHCSENFAKRIDLNKHLKTVHKDKTLVCEICNQAFTQIQTLKRHSKIHQSDQRNKLCPFCGKCFVRTDDLRRHVRIHTNERPYACDKCDKKYKQTSELKEHQKSHSDLKSYVCNVCGKTLATRNGIYVHMKVHNGIKNHECPTCNTKYVTAGQLSSHIKHIHSKQKPFLCSHENCPKSFVTNIALRAHVRSHCVEKKEFECSVCGKILASSSKLAAHKRSHGTTTDTNTSTGQSEFIVASCE